MIYLIGSLKNAAIPEIGKKIRNETGIEVFDEWHEAGPDADSYWQQGEIFRGKSYKDAIRGYTARHVFNFDLYHLNRATMGVLVMPAGKSGHLELGYLSGQGKPTYVLFDQEPEKYDQMYQFCEEVFFGVDELCQYLKNR